MPRLVDEDMGVAVGIVRREVPEEADSGPAEIVDDRFLPIGIGRVSRGGGEGPIGGVGVDEVGNVDHPHHVDEAVPIRIVPGQVQAIGFPGPVGTLLGKPRDVVLLEAFNIVIEIGVLHRIEVVGDDARDLKLPMGGLVIVGAQRLKGQVGTVSEEGLLDGVERLFVRKTSISRDDDGDDQKRRFPPLAFKRMGRGEFPAVDIPLPIVVVSLGDFHFVRGIIAFSFRVDAKRIDIVLSFRICDMDGHRRFVDDRLDGLVGIALGALYLMKALEEERRRKRLETTWTCHLDEDVSIVLESKVSHFLAVDEEREVLDFFLLLDLPVVAVAIGQGQGKNHAGEVDFLSQGIFRLRVCRHEKLFREVANLSHLDIDKGAFAPLLVDLEGQNAALFQNGAGLDFLSRAAVGDRVVVDLLGIDDVPCPVIPRLLDDEGILREEAVLVEVLVSGIDRRQKDASCDVRI